LFAGLLNKGFRGSLLLLIVFFAVSCLISYLAPAAIEHEFYPNLFYNYLTADVDNKLAVVLLNYLFIGVGVLLVSVIAVNQEIVDKINYFPVFIYLLICVASVSPQQISSQAFTNVFILYALYRLLDSYRKEDVLGQIFEAAFWLSCSAFITISSIISFPLFFIILLILRPFHWREWAVALLGFFVPIFIYECVAYLSDFNQGYLFRATVHFLQYLKVPSFSEYYIPLSVALFLMLLVAILHNLAYGFGNTVKKQRSRNILLWYAFFSLFGFFSGGANSSSILLTYALPLSFFIGDLFFQLKRVKITNTLLTILMLCAAVIILGQYGVI
jgi:hypothetical protein